MSPLASSAPALDWPEFRGPGGMGYVPEARLPLHWSEQSNVVWKVAIPGKAWSSPVVMEGRVWVTTASQDGHERGVMAVDARTGRVLVQRRLFEVAQPQFIHKFNSYGSPTPVAEPGRVYVTFGAAGTAALQSRTGQTLWQRRDLRCNHFRGAGSSPILWRDLLILHFDGADQQYVVALDKHTGRTVWRTDRTADFGDLDPQGRVKLDGDLRKAFSTPVVVSLQGRSALLSLGSQALYLYELATGRECWRFPNPRCHSGTCRPLFQDGIAVVAWGFSRGEVSALDLRETGWRQPPKELWRTSRNAPNKPTPVLVGDLLFMVDDGGVGSCLDWRTGETLWRARIGGNHSASLLAAGDRVYAFNEEGETHVFRAAPRFQLLALDRLAEGCLATPAITGHALILRTRTHLYRLETLSGAGADR